MLKPFTQQHLAKFQPILQEFLETEDFKKCIIDHLMHTRAWHYDHQTVRVELFSGKREKVKWIAPTYNFYARNGTCVLVLTQADYYWRKMEEIGEGENLDFEDILNNNPEEAKRIAEKLYAQQEAYIKQSVCRSLELMAESGYQY